MVEVTVGVAGQLVASHNDVTFDALSSGSMKLDLIGGRGGAINVDETAWAAADPFDWEAPPVLVETVGWQGEFRLGNPIPTNIGGFPHTVPMYEINKVDKYYFNTRLGEPFRLNFLLEAIADTVIPLDGLQAMSNFEANYRFRALDPVTREPISDDLFSTVPEDVTDIDGDGSSGIQDVDALVAEIVAGTHHPSFDVNSDGNVDQLDLDDWLDFAGFLAIDRPFHRGDANLDGAVDGQDFILWNDNKFSSNAAWSAGDFSADGAIDGLDFILWNEHKFGMNPRSMGCPDTPVVSAWCTTAAVPEPASHSMFLMLLLVVMPRISRGILAK